MMIDEEYMKLSVIAFIEIMEIRRRSLEFVKAVIRGDTILQTERWADG